MSEQTGKGQLTRGERGGTGHPVLPPAVEHRHPDIRQSGVTFQGTGALFESLQRKPGGISAGRGHARGGCACWTVAVVFVAVVVVVVVVDPTGGFQGISLPERCVLPSPT